MSNLIYSDESYRIIGACMAVYSEKGCGFLEGVYHESLKIEFELGHLPFIAKKLISLSYKGRSLKQRYQADFVCFDKILLEIKAADRIVDEHRAQLLNYLHATGYPLGLIVNFGHYPKLEWERMIHTPKP